MNEYMTTGDVAQQLRRSPDRIRQLEREGKLPALKTRSGQRFFKTSDVIRLAQQLQGSKPMARTQILTPHKP